MCKLRETEEDGEGKNNVNIDGHMEIKKRQRRRLGSMSIQKHGQEPFITLS